MKTDPLKEVYKIKEDTWDFIYVFSEENLFKKINDYGSISKLASEMNVENDKIIKWMIKLYEFLKENNSMNCFNQYNFFLIEMGYSKKLESYMAMKKQILYQKYLIIYIKNFLKRR